jgi:O-Antigen ligase
MTTEAYAVPHASTRFLGVTLEQLQMAVIWLMLVSSFFVIVEPAPSDLLFVVAVLCFLRSGLAINSAIAPLTGFLVLYNFGAFLSYLQISADQKALMFVITSAYMAASAIFFAFYIGQDTVQRFDLVKRALTLASVLVSVLGIIGYFDVAGLGKYFSEYERAIGTFKDPNVFSTYLIFPALMIVQGFLLGTQRHKFLSTIGLLIIFAALFLAFSRGAWISFVFSSVMMTGFTFMLTPSSKMRNRIVFLTVFGVVSIAIMLVLLLSIEQVRNLFLDRFTLVKSYDAGETGRFGNQLNSIPMLLERPLGFGPLKFEEIFNLAPHNVFINAFSSYGWLGGISYIVMIIGSIIIGFKSMITRTPWQNAAIVCFCPLVSTIFQGVQIDTDHWRHFYLLLGLTWGLFAASIHYVQMENQKHI